VRISVEKGIFASWLGMLTCVQTQDSTPVAKMSRPSSQHPKDFLPLRIHHNGCWYRSVWNSITRKTEPFYFGKVADDPHGDQAISDPVIG
jgi:hypothetical protein